MPAQEVSHAMMRRTRPSNKVSVPLIDELSAKPNVSVSTVPANGDVNPYGVAFVPAGFKSGGSLHPGDVLVSNFNNSSNQQGTGTTIVSISRRGQQTVFYHGPAGLGLTTALGVLKHGFVIVGNLPATYDSQGNLLSVGQGSLIIVNRFGQKVANLTDPKLLDGPWDMAVVDHGSTAQLFVSNVLNGTVTRIDLKVPGNGRNVVVKDMVQIGSGYAHSPNASALVVGPTGLAFDHKRDVLYVASTGDNAIYAISNAAHASSSQGIGTLVYSDPAHLRGPLGLALSPDGNLLTTNGDAINPNSNQPSELIEFTRSGKFLGQLSLDPVQGAAFGLAVSGTKRHITLVTVNDDTNKLDERFVTT
jgi:hypothetical protein